MKKIRCNRYFLALEIIKTSVKKGLSYPFCLKSSVRLAILTAVILTGCARTVPVSTTIETHSKDSTSLLSSNTLKDSTVYIETETEKKLPGSTVEITSTQSQFDSLIRALQAMPTNVTRTIYKVDPSMQSTVSILLDSLGKIHFLCSSAERAYYEKSVKDGRYISSLQSELSRVLKENSTLKEQIKVTEKSWWGKLKDSLRNWLAILCLVFIGIGLMVILGKYLGTVLKGWVV